MTGEGDLVAMLAEDAGEEEEGMESGGEGEECENIDKGLFSLREDGYQSVCTHKRTFTHIHSLSHTCMKYRWRWGGSEECKW